MIGRPARAAKGRNRDAAAGLLVLLLTAAPAPAVACGPATQQAAALGGRMLDDSLTLRFADARARVPEFGAWAYGWAQSYANTWRIIGHAAARTLDTVARDSALPPFPSLSQAMARPVEHAFLTRVIRPAFADGAFAADMAHLAQSMGTALPAAPGLAARLHATLPAEPLGMLAEGADITTVQLRAARPMAMRAGGMVLQVIEAGSLIGGAGYLGWSMAGGPGVVLASAGGIGAFWAVDWAVNRIDTAMHRPEFEAHARRAIDAAQTATRAAGQRAIDAALAESCRP